VAGNCSRKIERMNSPSERQTSRDPEDEKRMVDRGAEPSVTKSYEKLSEIPDRASCFFNRADVCLLRPCNRNFSPPTG
jgi:hypothetical protein